jgi:very-short-patch-repair endonuclease
MKPDAFKSSEEIVTAISLYEQGYFFKINYKILKYTVDFYLPDEKIILEIDGVHHDIGNCRAKDGRRDVDLRNELGYEWEIVRIPTNYVNRYPTKIGEAAEQLAWKQRELRSKNHGMLPHNYSKSVKAYYEDVLKE